MPVLTLLYLTSFEEGTEVNALPAGVEGARLGGEMDRLY